MILKNGKRIDGCTDTLPVGTVQPFLGLTPPTGYLVCQGQLIKKTEYPELYNICKSTFGAETETHFYLPDLRGKTIAGYDANNNEMNSIGKLLGSLTHTHTNVGHTHTIEGHTHTSAAHTHGSQSTRNGSLTAMIGTTNGNVYQLGYMGENNIPANAQVTHYYIKGSNYGNSGTFSHLTQVYGETSSSTPGDTGSTSLTTDNSGSGDTGSNSNFQPTITMNWIVKAVMLIPDYFIVENTLESNNTSNALSAAQGKELNDKFGNYLPLSGGTLTGLLKLSGSGLETLDPAGITMDIYGNLKHKRDNDADSWCITNYEGDKSLRYVFGTGSLQIPSELYVDSKKIARFKASTPEFDSTYASGAWFRVHENGGNMLMVGGGLQILKEVPSRTPFITIPGVNSSYSSFQYSLIATGSNDVGFRFRAYNSGNGIVIDNEDCNLPVGWYNVTGFIYLRD